jgi:alpha-ketoglutarate-dependent taurine dioxygenase
MVGIVAFDGSLGAEVRGWQPDREITEDERAQLLDALDARLVLVLRGQPQPTDDQIARLAHSFGEVYAGGDSYGVPMSHRDVLQVSNQLGADGYEVGIGGSGVLPWHTDYSFLPTPARETLLEAFVLPASGGPATYFCDMYSAWETLPDDTRRQLIGKRATHAAMASASYLAARTSDDSDAPIRAERRNPKASLPGGGGPATHPMVVTHPRTGRTALYVSEFIAAIDGMEDIDAHRLTVELLAHATKPERVYRHNWQAGDLLVFDTIGTVHRRDLSHHGETRTMRQLSTVVAALSGPEIGALSAR